MLFRFENQGSHTYLVYDILQTEHLDSFVKGMLTNNKISGLANTIFTQVDKKYCIHYEISSMISASQLFTGTLNKKRMLGFFRGILDAFVAVEEYLLDETMLILDCDYIFTNVSTGKTVMICLPVQNTELLQEKKDVIGFLRSILYHAKFDRNDDNSYIALLMNYFNSNTRFTTESFKILMDEIEEVKLKNPKPVFVQQERPIQNIINPVQDIPENPVALNNIPLPVISQVSSNQETQNAIDKMTTESQIVNHSSITLPNGSTMTIPGGDSSTIKSWSDVKDENKTSTSETEQISWLYLMQHYNKENAAKYKAQKKAKKAEKKNKGKQKTEMLIPDAEHTFPANQMSPGNFSSYQQVSNLVQQNYHKIQQPSMQSVPSSVSQKQVILQHTAYQGTTVLNPNIQAGTTVLNPNQSMRKKACLYRFKNRERIEVKGDFFRIGRESTYADYCIFDNSAISSSHAYIIYKNEKYYLVDTNSTNNTYINNNMIPSNAEKEIHDGDKICFADEEFEFKIM